VSAAKRLLVASETFSADALLEIGFLDHLVMPAQLEEKVQGYAEHIAALAPLSVRAMKQIIQQAAGTGIDYESAQRLADSCSESDDLQEGFAAQREKRDPRFKGR
jgi:enoyl-CoA hydratase/carnithine racemase